MLNSFTIRFVGIIFKHIIFRLLSESIDHKIKQFYCILQSGSKDHIIRVRYLLFVFRNRGPQP